MRIQTLLAVVLLAGGLVATNAWGQGAVPPTAKAIQTPEQAAPIDLTGYWASVVTEDWRWRMLTPPKGDYASVPLSPLGKQVADTFDPSRYGPGQIDCRAYGAAGLMRMPTRVHVTWASPTTLKIESDWGEQTRLLHFDAADQPGDPTAQGDSRAQWVLPEPLVTGLGFFAPTPAKSGGKLKVITDHLSSGWLRRNGVPYSNKTVVTEFFQVFTDPVNRRWFDVTTKVVDPQYLMAPFITSSDFRREPDGSKWAPHPCKG